MMPAPLTLTAHIEGAGVIRVAAAGEIDMSNCETLRDRITATFAGNQLTELVIDLDQVSFLDSTGIDVLVAGWRTAQRAATDYRVINAHGTVLRVLEITGITILLDSRAAELRATVEQSAMREIQPVAGT
jgi:anti-sigma B factor antagonist